MGGPVKPARRGLILTRKHDRQDATSLLGRQDRRCPCPRRVYFIQTSLPCLVPVAGDRYAMKPELAKQRQNTSPINSSSEILPR
jgi:hypothetical protein